MSKRPSLFAAAKPAPAIADSDTLTAPPELVTDPVVTDRPPSRIGKRVLSIYLHPLAWKQLRELALEQGTSTQALGEEAINLLFAKYGLNRSA